MIRLLETQCPAEHRGRCSVWCLPGCSMQHGTKVQNPALQQEAGERRHPLCEVWLQCMAWGMAATHTVVAAWCRSAPQGVGMGPSGAPPGCLSGVHGGPVMFGIREPMPQWHCSEPGA